MKKNNIYRLINMQSSFITKCWLLLILALFSSCLFANQKGLERVSPTVQKEFNLEERVAVIVGLSKYPSHGGLTLLEYADNDAVIMGEQLESMGYKVRVLTNEQATSGAVLNVLDDLGQYIETNQGTILFYFSGHGFAHNKTNYLATYESNPSNIQYTGLALKRVVEKMKKTGARRQVLLVDACRNDPTTGEKSVNNQRSFNDFELSEGTQILFSTKFGGKSYEYSNLGHGVYTHYLLEGLRGKARKGDGMLTFDDLVSFVSRGVKNYAYKVKHTQVPFVAGESSGEFLIHASTPSASQTSERSALTASNSLHFPKKRKSAWYKNPWLWIGLVAGGGALYYSQTQGGGGGGDRGTVIE